MTETQKLIQTKMSAVVWMTAREIADKANPAGSVVHGLGVLLRLGLIEAKLLRMRPLKVYGYRLAKGEEVARANKAAS